MKTRIGMIAVAMAMASSAQTNLITFTNRNHEVISNAVVIRHDAVSMVYMTGGASGGSVKLADLPPDLQKRFGYDPLQAASAERKESELRSARSKAAQAIATEQAAAETKRKRREEVSKMETIVWGRVIQRLDKGLLVNADSQIHGDRLPSEPAMYDPDLGRAVRFAKGIVLLSDYRGHAVDDDVVYALAYPVQDYEYTAVSGAKKTVRQYTADIDNCIPPSEVRAILKQMGHPIDSR